MDRVGFPLEITNRVASLHWAKSWPVRKSLLKSAVEHGARSTAHLKCLLRTLSGPSAFRLRRRPRPSFSFHTIGLLKGITLYWDPLLLRHWALYVVSYHLAQTSSISDLWGIWSSAGKPPDCPGAFDVLHRRSNESSTAQGITAFTMRLFFDGLCQNIGKSVEFRLYLGHKLEN